MPEQTPYTDADRRLANKILYDLDQLQFEFERQTACGIDCQEGQLRRQDLRDRIMAWKQTYFPDKR